MTLETILGLVVTFIMGFLLDLTKPGIRTFFQKSALSFRNRRIKTIRENYWKIKEYNEKPALLAVHAMKLMSEAFFRLILFLTVLGAILIVGIYDDPSQLISYTGTIYIMAIFGGFVASKFDDVVVLINRTINFKQYEEKTLKRLNKLGVGLTDEQPKKNVARTKRSSANITSTSNQKDR